MAKNRSNIMIFADHSWPAEALADALSLRGDVDLWMEGRGWTENPSLKSTGRGPRQTIRQKQILSPMGAARFCDLGDCESSQPLAIIGFEDPESSQKVAQVLKDRQHSIRILQVGGGYSEKLEDLNTQGLFDEQRERRVAWSELLANNIDKEIHLLSLQKRVSELRAYLADAERIAIMLQNDPDPDGIAGALALRKLLGRKAQSAPIVSLGRLYRPENVAMARLLDIEIEKIQVKDLDAFDKVVLIDCQPSFFKGQKIPANVILDHHPKVTDSIPESVGFVEIRENLGALSTLMTLFLMSAGIVPSQRLATALLYGIKTDTLSLNRQVSAFDLDAFVFLYPLINGNILRRIERPELPLGYLESLRLGLKHFVSKNGVAVLGLPKVERDEWIPQSADFALQTEGAEWALGCGVFENNFVISGRNCGYVQHCGDLFKELFESLGCAGGHRTMAKAIIPVSKWHKEFGAGSSKPERANQILWSLAAQKLLKT